MKELMVWIFLNCAGEGSTDYRSACVYAFGLCPNYKINCLKKERTNYYGPIFNLRREAAKYKLRDPRFDRFRKGKTK